MKGRIFRNAGRGFNKKDVFEYIRKTEADKDALKLETSIKVAEAEKAKEEADALAKASADEIEAVKQASEADRMALSEEKEKLEKAEIKINELNSQIVSLNEIIDNLKEQKSILTRKNNGLFDEIKRRDGKKSGIIGGIVDSIIKDRDDGKDRVISYYRHELENAQKEIASLKEKLNS